MSTSFRGRARSALLDDIGEANAALTRLLHTAQTTTELTIELNPSDALRDQLDDLRTLVDAVAAALGRPRPSMPGALAPSP